MDKKDSEKYNSTSKPEKRNRSSSESSSKNVNHKKYKRKHKQSSDTDVSSSHRKKRSKHCKHNKKHKKEREQNKRDNSFDVPISLMNSNKEMAPMTKNEWEKKQSVIKRVFDESSGRYRLIKGDGEVIEEIVSKEKHKEINQQATREDGIYFETQLSTHLKK